MTLPHNHEVETLKRELIGLFQHIQKIRKEIAQIRRPGSDAEDDHFLKMSDELDAIVEATEGATNTIMENVEQLDDIINAIRPHVSDPDALKRLDEVPEKTGHIFEACAFQDITGQRITKVVTSLQFIEERVNTLIAMWGQDEIADERVAGKSENDEYKKFLNGPQLAGHGVSQADVDAMLFGNAPPPSEPEHSGKKVEVKKGEATASKDSKAGAKAASNMKAPEPAPAPKAPAKAEEPAEDEGPSFSQDDIDKLFG